MHRRTPDLTFHPGALPSPRYIQATSIFFFFFIPFWLWQFSRNHQQNLSHIQYVI